MDRRIEILRKENLIKIITIPKFPLKIKVANKIRPKYFKKRSRGVPSKYKLNKQYDDRGRLIDPDTKEPVIKNAHEAGKPRYIYLSGNSAGFTNKYTKAKVARELKEFYHKCLVDISSIPRDKFPLVITFDLYLEIDTPNFDLSNYWFYYKYLEDCLRDLRKKDGKNLDRIIPEDNIRYLTMSGSAPLIIPIDDNKDRKFVLKFYQDTREEIINNKVWRDAS